MHWISVLVSLLFLYPILFSNPIEKPDVVISAQDTPRIIVGINNPIQIIAQQSKPIYQHQINLRFLGLENDPKSYASLSGDKGNFVVKVDTTGVLLLSIKTDGGVVEKKLRCVAMEAETQFGGLWRSGKMGNGVFKAQAGILAVVTCCNFEARCDIVDFEVLKINARGLVFRGSNTGGAFDATIRPIINKALPGDIYWFRNIRYRCWGSGEHSYGRDIAVEIE